MTTIDAFALALGYTIMIVAGLFAMLGLLLLALDALWQKIKDGQELWWVVKAMRHYREIEPCPRKDES